jgi:hypothetical protein
VKRIAFEGVHLSLFGTVELGPLIAHLRNVEFGEDPDGRTQTREVWFDFGSMRPAHLASYRGYYDHLALGFASEGAPLTVTDLLARLKATVGETFSGWKGGEYRMTESTPVWVANRGEATQTSIVGLCVEEWRVTILTGYEP